MLQDYIGLTLMCKKSLTSNVIAHPCIGESSSFLPSNATFVRTANATGFVYKKYYQKQILYKKKTIFKAHLYI